MEHLPEDVLLVITKKVATSGTQNLLSFQTGLVLSGSHTQHQRRPYHYQSTQRTVSIAKMSTLKFNGGADHKKESPTFPYIQETVRKNPLNVPKSYVRNEEQMEKHLYMPHLSSHLPIIDFGLISNGNKEELLKLDVACKEWGYFQIVNHGMQIDLMQRLKDAVAEFLELSIEEKIKYAMPPDDMQGYGHTSVDWSDYLVLLAYPTRFRKPQFWPEELKDTIGAYSSEIKRIGEEVINSLSLLLGLEEHGLLGLHKEVHQGFRVNYYPPCNTPEKVLGVSPHSDPRTIALVMQDDNVPGTEIRYKGNWVPITPIPGALVVNVGDVIEILSNGKYKSVEHRAITNKKKKRTTFISYLFPQGDAEIGPLDRMLDDQNPKMYKDTTYGEYLRHMLNRKLEGKPHINATKINEWIGE